MEDLRFDSCYHSESLVFKTDDPAYLPTFDKMRFEICKHVPSDFKVTHSYGEYDSFHIYDIEFSRPYGSHGEKRFYIL